MAREEIIIDVKIVDDSQIERLAAMRSEMQRLKNENKELEKQKGKSKESDKAINEQIARNTLDYKELSGEVRQYEKVMLNEVKAAKLAENSLTQMRAQLSNLTAAYDNLSQAERQTAKGKEMLSKIQGLTENLSLAEAETGRFQRMVGNYPDVFNLGSSSIGKFQKMISGLGATSTQAGFSFKTAFKSMGQSAVSFGKTLLATPIGWISAAIAALVGIISKLIEAFKKNDDAMTALQTAFAVFQPIIDFVNKLFEKLANTVAAVVTSVMNGVGKLLNFFGIASKESQDYARDLILAADKLEDVEREYAVNSAKRDAEISELRAKSKDKEKFNAKEREKMLKDAIELEKQNLEDEKKIAAEKLRIMIAQAKQQADTSDETKDKIAQAQAEMYRAEKSYNDGTRRLLRELDTTRREIAAEEKKRQEDAIKALKERQSKEVAAIRQMQDLLIQQYEDATTMAVAQEQIRAAREIEDLKKRLSTEKDLTLKARQAIEESISLIAENSQAKIDALYDAASENRFNDEIQKEQNKISLLLEIAEKGSENEYNLKIEQIELLRKKEIEEAEKTGADINLINEKFNLQIAEADKQRIILTEKEKKQALENSYNEARLNFQGHLEELAQIEIDKANENHNYLVNLDEETKKALFESDAAYTAALLQSKEEIFNAEQKIQQIQQQSFESQVKSIQTFGSTISDVLGEIAGDSKEFLVFQKLIALANASLNLATAISAATSSSTVGDPYTMAARIVANVGAVVASFIQVTKSIKQANVPDVPRFEKGVNAGVVPGNSFSGDKVLIRVNSGETVLTRDQKDNLIKSMANGVSQVSFDYELFSNILAQKIKEIPAPVLDYKEFTNFVNNKVRFDEYANI